MGAARWVLAAGALAAAAGPHARAGESAPGRTVVLETRSYWRCHVTLRPPVYGTTGEDARPNPEAIPTVRTRDPSGKSVRVPILPPDRPRSPLPAAGWTGPEFDDTGWWRDPGPFYGGASERTDRFPSCHISRFGFHQPESLALLCLRGKFTVTDPAQVRGLALSAEFRGGIVVYLNGQEVVRRHMPEGRINLETLAKAYPLEAYASGGSTIRRERLNEAQKKACRLRFRTFEGLALPADALRNGTNVLTLEIHRAPIHPGFLKLRGKREGCQWSTAGLSRIELTAAGSGVNPNTQRPPGVQVWNAGAVESVFDTDYGDAHDALRPIRIVAARNGTFSGQVVVGSDRPLTGLAAEMSALRREGGAGALPASAARIRYPRPGGGEVAKKVTCLERESRRFDALAASPPEPVPVKTAKRPPPGLGAVQPVWVKVRVPPDAVAGAYAGTLTVRASGKTFEAPVELLVHDFRLPDPEEIRTWAEFIQSPESLALYYKVPLWSERHFALIGRSFELLREVNSRTLHVPLICRTNHGNSESMVRWIRRPGGGYTHDFRVMERYIDLALEKGLRPQSVYFQVWDYHLGIDPDRKMRWGVGGYGGTTEIMPIPVSLLDPVTGKVTETEGPKYTDPEAKAFWRPVAEGVRERMRKRGLEKVMMLGLLADQNPHKGVFDLWKELLPGTPWACMAHGGAFEVYGVPIRYRTTVMHTTWAIDPASRRYHGWERPEAIAWFPRLSNDLALAFNRMIFEMNIQGRQRGVGRLAADFFPVGDDRRTLALSRRYPESSWRNLNLREAWLAPGPEGAISTVRFEMAREGIQECEARIFIEQALADEAKRARLGEDLARRCQEVLDERTRCNLWALEVSSYSLAPLLPGGPLGFDWYAGGSGWQERSSRLYAAAAEVARALGERGDRRLRRGPRASPSGGSRRAWPRRPRP